MASDSIDAQIQEHLAAAYASIREAEKLARDHKRTFFFSVTYGMGGYFDPTEAETDGGWISSSQNC